RGLADLGHHEPDMLADLVPDRTGSTAARAVGLAVIGVGLAAGLHHATTDSSLSWPALALAVVVPGKRRGRRWAGLRSGQCELPGSAAELFGGGAAPCQCTAWWWSVSCGSTPLC